MNDVNGISFVVGYQHHPQRLPLLLKCLSSLRDYNQLCIVESGPSKVLTWEVLREVVKGVDVKYLKIYTTTPYNRAWNFNIGVRHLATFKIVVTVDADLVFPPDYTTIIRKYVINEEYVGVAWSKLYYLNHKDTEATLKLPSYEVVISEPLRMVNPSKAGAAGGAFVSFRSTYFKFGGMDERFFGRTSEDNAFWAKLEALGYTVQTLPASIFHLYHPINPVVAPNRQEVFRMLGWSKEKWLEEMKPNWGSIDGFTTGSL